MSLRAVFVTIIVGATVWTTRADNSAAAAESQCREEIERELQEYAKLESWQKLFMRHFKFVVNGRGEILSERKRLKFSTITHNAIFGCGSGLDDELDYCPNIYQGSIKTCEQGKNLKAAMFRTARCVFVESSVKHLVLSDALLDTYPAEKLDRTSVDVDAPIRRFGGTVADMLSALARGESGRLGELMALNMYLNNEYDTVLMYRAPAEPVASAADWQVARERSRRAHAAILDKMRTVWGTWCGDKDPVAQYRRKHAGDAHATVLDAMAANADETDRLIRDLNFTIVSAAAGVDFEPRRVALTDFVDGLIAAGSMPAAVLDDLRLQRFETSYAFDPLAVRAHHGHVFRAVYACFYWTTVAHLRLAARAFDAAPRGALDRTAGRRLFVGLVKFVRPLTVFDINRLLFPAVLSPEASANLIALLSFLLRVYRDAKNATPGHALLSAMPRIREFADLLHADMRRLLDARAPQPDDRFDRLTYETAGALMRSNYNAFARLVSATSRFKEDRKNAIRLKAFMPFLSEAVEPAATGTITR